MAMTIEAQLARTRDEAARHQIEPGRLLAALVAYTCWAVGWAVRRTWVLTWRALGFALAAGRLGWRDAAPAAPKRHQQ